MCRIMVIFTCGNLNHINMVKIARMGYNLYIMLAKVKLTYNSKISLKENFNNAFKFDNEEFKKSALGNGTPLVPERPQAAQE